MIRATKVSPRLLIAMGNGHVLLMVKLNLQRPGHDEESDGELEEHQGGELVPPLEWRAKVCICVLVFVYWYLCIGICVFVQNPLVERCGWR